MNQNRVQDAMLKEELTSKLKDMLDFYSEHTGEGPFFLGQHISLADVAIIPFIGRFALTLPHYRSYDLLGIDDRLKQWHDAFVSRPSWQKSFPPAATVVKAYSTYANPKSNL